MNKKAVFIISVLIIFTFINAVSAENSTNINLEINYEYNDEINPEILISNNNNNISYKKEVVQPNNYKININNSHVGKKYSISVSARGYITQIQNVTINPQLTANIIFNLKATDIYKIGYDVTKSADNLL